MDQRGDGDDSMPWWRWFRDAVVMAQRCSGDGNIVFAQQGGGFCSARRWDGSARRCSFGKATGGQGNLDVELALVLLEIVARLEQSQHTHNPCQ